jgi:lipoate synthase
MLISFDIDGTMVFGDPPGDITVEDLRKVRELGFIVGSGSDRTIAEQSELWQLAGFEVDFVSLKHRLAELKQRFMVKRYVHVGDTLSDKMLAKQAGFDFVNSSDVCREDFFLLLTGEVSLGPERKT